MNYVLYCVCVIGGIREVVMQPFYRWNVTRRFDRIITQLQCYNYHTIKENREIPLGIQDARQSDFTKRGLFLT